MLFGGDWDTDGMSEDVQELFRYKDGGTVEVHKWVCDVQLHYFRGLPKVCKDGEPEKEAMPTRTRKAIGRIWQEVLEDVEAKRVYEEHFGEKH